MSNIGISYLCSAKLRLQAATSKGIADTAAFLWQKIEVEYKISLYLLHNESDNRHNSIITSLQYALF